MMSEGSMMRILFTFAGGSGHADPLVPIAAAVRAAGHTVAFSGRRSGAAVAEAQGFRLFADPADPTDGPQAITPLRTLDMENENRVLRDFYAGVEARRRATKILDLIAEWHPDLVVCDEVDFGSMIAAERLDLPHATVLITAAGSFVRPEIVAESLDALRAEHGLSPDRALSMPSRHLVVSPFPPSFRDPAFPLPRNAFSIRPKPVIPHDHEMASQWRSLAPERPAVYFTLGTVFNTESGDLFERAIAGLRALPIEVVVTVGRDIDPSRFGPQPEHVHIERYIPQSALLPLCDLVVNHGGSGSVIVALAHGLPMVVLPMGADQSLNASRCEQLGVGIALDAVTASPRAIGDAVDDVLGGTHHRVAAEAIRDEIEALPGPATMVPLLERLTSGGIVGAPS
jgi:UDP:flavonoid glycosyltransferase YjiC (YdhE family)